MTERWRSEAARELVQAIRAAGGTVERSGVGRLKISANGQTITIQEPGTGTRRDLRRSSAAKLIKRLGIDLE